MLCGVGFHHRVKGIKSESWSWELKSTFVFKHSVAET